jgi:hypothetical protein
VGKLLVTSKYVVFVFSSDINERRRHIHIRDNTGKINKLCKYWIEPETALDKNEGFNLRELNEINKLISKNLFLINNQLDKFYAGQKVKSIKI